MEKGGIESHEYGGRKHTRFPCLATARYVVAGVVSVLTVAVVVTVIIVALRPEKVIFSIPHQYILADRPWWDDAPAGMAASSEQAPIPSRVGGGRATSANAGTATSTKTVGPGELSVGDTEPYPPVKNVSFLVGFTAENPSGRADVSGENVIIRVLAMPNYYESPSSSSYFRTTTLTEIVTMKDDFTVDRQTSYTLRKWILVDDADVLAYLAEMYGGWRNIFTAMVHVNATTSRAGEPQNYYCWPVPVFVVGWQPSGYDYDRSTSCRPEKEMDANVSSTSPPPAPVLAAAPAPIQRRRLLLVS